MVKNTVGSGRNARTMKKAPWWVRGAVRFGGFEFRSNHFKLVTGDLIKVVSHQSRSHRFFYQDCSKLFGPL